MDDANDGMGYRLNLLGIGSGFGEDSLDCAFGGSGVRVGDGDEGI
jgi:hypothetical protein